MRFNWQRAGARPVRPIRGSEEGESREVSETSKVEVPRPEGAPSGLEEVGE